MYFLKEEKYQFAPFIAAQLAFEFTDLLHGMTREIVISVIFVFKSNSKANM